MSAAMIACVLLLCACTLPSSQNSEHVPSSASSVGHENISKDVARSSSVSEASSARSDDKSITLITEPDDGIAPVESMMQSARSSIDLVMYELEDQTIEQLLVAAHSRGVAVRVLLNKGYKGKQDPANETAFAYLQSHGVSVHWTSAVFSLTHQKTLVVDHMDALIMTFNLTPRYYASSREFAVQDTIASDVSAIEQTFDADWDGRFITANPGSDLVWSPGSEDALLSLIQHSHASLLIYNEEMADDRITAALQDAARRGVRVRLVMTDSSSWTSSFDALAAAGVEIRTFAPAATLYIHTKMIVADGKRAFVGSENFSSTSLLRNRELGIIVTNPIVIESLQSTFQNDWQHADSFE